MLILLLFLLLAVLAMPFIMEAARLSMDDSERDTAPGQCAKLSQGVTHFQWTGPDDGPVIICIHGLTTPSFVWQSVARGLAEEGYRVLTYDLYGRGYSDRPIGRQTPEFFLRQLNDLLEDQNVQGDLTILGYSMGGAIATAFAASRPEDVRQLVLLAPAGMRAVGDDWVRSMVRTPLIGIWLMLLFYPRILKRGLEAEARLPTSVPAIAQLQRAELDYRGFIRSVHSSLRGMLTDNLRNDHEKLNAMGVPVLAIWGAEDDVIPLASKDSLSKWNPDSVHYVIEDAGHGLTYTHTPDVLEQIKVFLKMSS